MTAVKTKKIALILFVAAILFSAASSQGAVPVSFHPWMSDAPDVYTVLLLGEFLEDFEQGSSRDGVYSYEPSYASINRTQRVFNGFSGFSIEVNYDLHSGATEAERTQVGELSSGHSMSVEYRRENAGGRNPGYYHLFKEDGFLDFSDGVYLGFFIRGRNGGEKLRVHILDEDDILDPENEGFDFGTAESLIGAPVSADEWRFVPVPLTMARGSDLDLSRSKALFLCFEEGSGAIYIDDIRYYREQDVARIPPPEMIKPEGESFMLADFEALPGDGGWFNETGGTIRPFLAGESRAGIRRSTADAAVGQASLVLQYKQTLDGWSGFHTMFGDDGQLLDASGYSCIGFWIKGEEGGERVNVGVTDLTWSVKQDSLKCGTVDFYLPAGRITPEWQFAVIPLSHFTDVCAVSTHLDYERLFGMAFLPMYGEGKIYIDGIQLLKTENPVVQAVAEEIFADVIRPQEEDVLICDFEDARNNTFQGGWVGPYEAYGSTAVGIVTSEKSRSGDWSMRIEYDRIARGWCGIYFKSHMANRYLDVTSYRYLSFWVKAGTPGVTFDVRGADRFWELREDGISAGDVGVFLPRSLDSGPNRRLPSSRNVFYTYERFVPTEWTQIVIPLWRFGQIDYTQLADFVLNFNTIGKGVLYIDDVMLHRNLPEGHGADVPFEYRLLDKIDWVD